jgi:tRNA A-37 threonylcarbamoyl transferase component Bud32
LQIIGRRFSVGSTSYQVSQELNSGGFGTVYLAEPTPSSGEPSLVVKVPATHVLHDAEWRQRFQREARILGNISHPNVVKTLGLLSYDDGAVLLVQELIEGATELVEWKYSHPGELVSVALQVLYGLRCTHGTSEDARAIHRDLSPRNVLITQDGVAKIIDFGLAKEDPRTTGILTVAGRAFGTPGCMAPEQRSNAATVDHRADLYALGRSLASCIQKRHPEYIQVPALVSPWREIIQQLTEYSPDDRFTSAAAAIRRILSDFHAEGILPANVDIHFEEFRLWESIPAEWGLVARDYFLWADTLTYEDLQLAYRVTKALLASADFMANDVFAKLDSEIIEDHFGSSLAAFDDCDPLGKMIKRWYPFLNREGKAKAFRRLCRVALSYHRYSVMGSVRMVYGSEVDEALRAEMLVMLEEEDPTGVIHGKGIIPR